MKRISIIIAMLLFTISLWSQAPKKFSYQAIVRDAQGKLLQSSAVGIRFTILQGTPAGQSVYSETHQTVTNVNGLITLEVGSGNTVGSFDSINWADGPYFLSSETDPSGGTNYSITGVTQLLSVPYALYSGGGDYNNLANKPVTDGSETKIHAGTGLAISGAGTMANPYLVKCQTQRVILTQSQSWTVPDSVSRIRVELWGGAGGGGGAGAYSYSSNLNDGGNGGTGGYALQELDVQPDQQFYIYVGDGGLAGVNAYWSSGHWYGGASGGNGGDSFFGSIKAAGGTGGLLGSTASYTIHGSAGTSNNGTITAYSEIPYNNILDVFTGVARSYIHDRVLTSRSGKGGGVISPYSIITQPTSGEGGCAIITFLE